MSGFIVPTLNTVNVDPRNVTITQCVLFRSERVGLDPDKLATIIVASKEEFPAKYHIVKTASLSGDKLAQTNFRSSVSLDVINTSVLSRLRMYDLNSFFEQFPLVENGVWDANQETLNLFESLDQLTDQDIQERIFESVIWINTEVNEPEWLRELVWSRDIILAACDSFLVEAILAKERDILEAFPGATGGPITFVVLMEIILSMSSDAFNELYRFIQKLDIKTYEGEDINEVVRNLRVNLRRLYACTSKGYLVPPTVETDLIKVFQTTSCDKFNDVFAALKVQTLIQNNSRGTVRGGAWRTSATGGPKYKDILRIAEATFNEYKDEWVVESTQQNPGQHGFNTMNQGGKSCHKCGSTKHLKRDCPQSGNSNRGGNTNDSGGNNNRSNQRGNQDPRLVAPNPSDSRCSKVSDSPRRWDRSFEDGITRSWCAKCVLRRTSTGQDNTNPGRWTDGRAKHYTDEHRGNNTTGGNNNRANLAQSNGGRGNGRGSQSRSNVPNEVQTEGSSASQSSATQQSGNTSTSGNVLSLAQALTDLSQ